MKRQFLITLITLLTAIIGHAADDCIVDGVTYEWSNTELGYIATGWDEETPIQSLHIYAEVNGFEVVGIAAEAFEDNDDIVFVTIDEGIVYIGQNAFCRCGNLEAVLMPEGLVTIEEEAFAFCTKLTTVVIPSTVEEIQSHAFSGCTGVEDVYFLMDSDGQLDNFYWWDGVYHVTPQEGGGMEFNTNAHTVIHVPDGMLQDYEDSEKFVAWLPLQEDDNSYPLWWIVNYGVVGRTYTVSDALTAVHVDVDGGLYAKDDNNWLTKDQAYPNEINYMSTTGLMADRNNIYDQSNWVVLQNVDDPDSFTGYSINGSTITGTLLDKTNPVIEVSEDPERGQQQSYISNTYIAASLMTRTQVGANGRTYAFVRPKPQELAKFEWTIYGGDDDFYMPAPDIDENINTNELKGGFNISDGLYENASMPLLEEGGHYPFSAIIRRSAPYSGLFLPRQLKDESAIWEPYTEGGISPWYVVYPLLLPDDPIITAADRIEVDNSPKSLRYYDLNGRYIGTSLDKAGRGFYITGNGRKIVK